MVVGANPKKEKAPRAVKDELFLHVFWKIANRKLKE
jgi:hypothetical protein